MSRAPYTSVSAFVLLPSSALRGPHIRISGIGVFRCEKATRTDVLQICLAYSAPACRNRLVAWKRAGHVPPHLSSAVAGTTYSGDQKEHPMNEEAARGVSSHQQPIQEEQAFTWGCPPTTSLPFRTVVRLTIMRSKLEAVRRERGTWLHSANNHAA